MAERDDRDLVAELRRVDDAFAGLKAGRSEVVERLLDGDTDELVRQSERRLRGPRVRAGATVVGALALALGTVVAVRLIPAAGAPDVGADGALARTSPPAATAPATTPPPTAVTRAADATTVVTTMSTAPATAAAPTSTPPPPPPPSLRRLPLRRSSAEARGALARLGDAALQPLSPLSPLALSTTATPDDAATLTPDAVGVAAPIEVRLADEDIDEAVRGARRLASRGALDDAIALLTGLLERGPAPRIVDVVMVEQARLQHRAGRTDEACATLAAHHRRFPTSDNVALVDAERARWSCR